LENFNGIRKQHHIKFRECSLLLSSEIFVFDFAIWNMKFKVNKSTILPVIPTGVKLSHSLLYVGCWGKNFSLKERKKQKAEKCIEFLPFNTVRGFPLYSGYICCPSSGDTLKILRKTTITCRYNVYWHKCIIHKKLLTYTSVYLSSCKKICVCEVNVSVS
jgi:hypothetical protein